MTEDEAKTKWCPFASVMVRPVETLRDKVVMFRDCVSANRGEDNKPLSGVLCIGSACMAWRWKQRVANEDEMDRHRRSMMGGYQPVAIYEDTEHGYCGLAGRP